MTITLDASAAYELIAENTPRAERLSGVVAGHDFVVPSIFRYELVNLIRRALSQQELSREGADAILQHAMSMPIREFSFDAVFPRAWALWANYTFYDAAYIAVAEATGTVLVTLDERLASGLGATCDIFVPPGA